MDGRVENSRRGGMDFAMGEFRAGGDLVISC